MEQFKNPDRTFLWETLIEKLPPRTTMDIHPTGRQSQTVFNVPLYSLFNKTWTQILGDPLGGMYSILHHNIMVVISFVTDLFHPGFLKAFHFHIDDEYIKYLAHHGLRANTTDSQVKSFTSVFYAAEKAYVWGSDISIDGIKAFSHRNLVIGVDMTTRRPAPLDADWREKSLTFFENVNRENRSLELPKLAKDTGEVLHSVSLEIREGHLDYNRHANYKIYIFGGIVCIRDALDKNKFMRYLGLSMDGVIVRDSLTVFEKECVLGDAVTFDLVQTDDRSIFVVCNRENTRLAFTKYELDVIQNNNSQL